MGMFDSLYDDQGNEWQTKAYGCNLSRFQIGDKVPALPVAYQVRVLGGPGAGLQSSWATIRDGRVSEVPAKRDKSLPAVDYFGNVEEP
jgi:hypothetical protein